jgi:uncharacterized protein YecE (DUF72 family)
LARAPQHYRAQFAPWVAYHPEKREHIAQCQRQLDGYQLAIEFRNKSWFEGKHAAATLAFELECNLVNVIVDEPQGWRTRSRPCGR